MSLPSYLSNIKSSGIYRFVWDKSEIPGPQAETLRLVVGYSEKGPFNTPVYVRNASDFKSIYGGISKKLERYGVYFHRLALQALKKGPILALNLKPFDTETVSALSFNPGEASFSEDSDGIFDGSFEESTAEAISLAVKDIYNTNRFWTLEPEHLEELKDVNENYIILTHTDSKETSNTIVIRKYMPKGYDVTFKEWYSEVLNGEDIPSYLEGHEMDKIQDYWAEIYVFRGQFTKEVATSQKLKKFFNVEGDNVTLKNFIKNSFGEYIDALEALSRNGASNFIRSYNGILLPDFLSANNVNISLDVQFNQDNYLHKMMMRLNQSLLYNEEVSADSCKFEDFSNSIITPTHYSTDNTTTITGEELEALKDSYLVEGVDTNGFVAAIGEVYVEVNSTETTEEDEETNSTPTPENPNVPEGEPEAQAEGVLYVLKSEIETGVFEDLPEEIQDYYTASKWRSYINTLIYMKGYEYASSKPTNNTHNAKLRWQHKILDVLTNNKGIHTALISRNETNYRYIIDTFESFVEPECKSRLSALARERDNALAIINFPSMTTFRTFGNGEFLDANGTLDTSKIVESTAFSLATEENGASYATYNTCLNMRDINTGVKYVCPSAALVSNDFMDKYTKYFPYTIVAGPNRGVITDAGLIGPDFNFSREDLDNLEPMGVNCMVYAPGFGTYINSNMTAKQNPKTTLSYINVRELCIFLQDEIEKLLQHYQWDFNTPNLRATIKSRADVILETAKNNGGVFEYVNVCDESNNTDDVINNEMFILSTSIEPGIGAGKMIQELTLYRKGGMSSIIKTY